MVDAARGKGSASGGQERPGNDSGNGVAARTMDQPLNRAGGRLGLVKRKLKKVCDSYGLSVMKSLRLETFELRCSPVIGCAISADYQYADGWRNPGCKDFTWKELASVCCVRFVRSIQGKFVISIRHDDNCILGGNHMGIIM